MLYREPLIPINIFPRSVSILDHWSNRGARAPAPLDDFDFAKVSKLMVHVASGDTAKCVAGLRAAALDLCKVLREKAQGIEYLQLDIGSRGYDGVAWLTWSGPAGGDYRQLKSSLVDGLSDLEVVTQPFRTVRGIPRVDITIPSPRLLSLASVRAWKLELEQTMMSADHCTEHDLQELDRETETVKEALEYWKIFKRFDELWEDPENTRWMYDSERESHERDRESMKYCAYSAESEFSVDDPGCQRRKREYFTCGESETDSDSDFGDSDGECEEGLVAYCNGVRVDDLCC